jgi:hypothetical protein
LASIGDHAAVTPDHQRPAGRSPHSQRKG